MAKRVATTPRPLLVRCFAEFDVLPDLLGRLDPETSATDAEIVHAWGRALNEVGYNIDHVEDDEFPKGASLRPFLARDALDFCRRIRLIVGEGRLSDSGGFICLMGRNLSYSMRVGVGFLITRQLAQLTQENFLGAGGLPLTDLLQGASAALASHGRTWPPALGGLLLSEMDTLLHWGVLDSAKAERMARRDLLSIREREYERVEREGAEGMHRRETKFERSMPGDCLPCANCTRLRRASRMCTREIRIWRGDQRFPPPVCVRQRWRSSTLNCCHWAEPRWGRKCCARGSLLPMSVKRPRLISLAPSEEPTWAFRHSCRTATRTMFQLATGNHPGISAFVLPTLGIDPRTRAEEDNPVPPEEDGRGDRVHDRNWINKALAAELLSATLLDCLGGPARVVAPCVRDNDGRPSSYAQGPNGDAWAVYPGFAVLVEVTTRKQVSYSDFRTQAKQAVKHGRALSLELGCPVYALVINNCDVEKEPRTLRNYRAFRADPEKAQPEHGDVRLIALWNMTFVNILDIVHAPGHAEEFRFDVGALQETLQAIYEGLGPGKDESLKSGWTNATALATLRTQADVPGTEPSTEP